MPDRYRNSEVATKAGILSLPCGRYEISSRDLCLLKLHSLQCSSRRPNLKLARVVSHLRCLKWSAAVHGPTTGHSLQTLPFVPRGPWGFLPLRFFWPLDLWILASIFWRLDLWRLGFIISRPAASPPD